MTSGLLTIVQFKEGLALAEYLQIEQDLVREVKEPTLFTWIVPPTVIYGRHQCAEAEVNEDYCWEQHIAVVQRKSGGGCVYADEGNLMVSFVSPDTHAQMMFDAFLDMLATVLGALGYDVVTTAHNDVLVDGRKVAGIACYTTPRGTIVHACILYEVNLDRLQRAITPSPAKLSKHGVASVRQRVCNLRDSKDLGEIQVFRKRLENHIDAFRMPHEF